MTQTIEAQTEANRQSITETFEAWRDGTGTLRHTLATDMVWRIEGHAAVSREYNQ
jgi:ketosteroid isomerase-like protein